MDILPFHRKTSAHIDLAAIVSNFRSISALHDDASICAVIKANAYGHGDVEVARALEAAQAQWFAVALVEEGIHLRQAGIQTPILILGGALDGGYDSLVEHDLTPAIFTLDHLQKLHEATGSNPKSFHLKIDTGMSRLGLLQEELPQFLNALSQYPNLHLDGVLTHLANADHRDEAVNQHQINRFDEGVKLIEAAGYEVKFKHVANSAGTLTLDSPSGNLVRVGLGLYGLDPLVPRSEHVLKPALQWKTSIVHIKTIPADTRVSYGGNWSSNAPATIATLPVGYADGYPRSLASQAQVLVGGQRTPIVGNICMDLCMADITKVKNVKIGDEVVLLGHQGNEVISAYELADWAGTIPYEITTGISYRVPRKHNSVTKG